MGWLSKKWKSLKKAVKKIGKKVKGAFAKIGKAFGKLGILGQIGLMFLMPYATGALGSFFSAGGTLSKWAGTLMKSANIGAKALGHGLNVIQKAGSFVGKVYTTVSDTIGNAVDRVGNFAKGKGFTLSEGRTSVFAKGNERSIFSPKAGTTPTVAPSTPEIKLDFDSTTAQKDSTGMIDFEAMAKDVEINTQLNQKIPDTLGLKNTNSKNLLDFDASKVEMPNLNFTQDVIENKTTNTFMDTITSIPGNIAERVKNVSTDDLVDFGTQQITDVVIGGGKLAGKQQVAEALGYKQITPISYNINLDNALGSYSYNSVFNSIDYTTQPSGNNYYASNVANSNYLNNLYMPESPSYQQYMNQMSSDFYYGTA